MKSIKTKLVLYFSILILVSSISLGSTILFYAGNSISQEAEEGLQSIANEAARLTESRVETQKSILETLSNRTDMQSMVWASQQMILLRQINRSDFLALAIVQPDGTAYYNDGTRADLGDRDYIKRAFAGETNVSDLLISPVTNEPVLIYATPIERGSDVVGVLIGQRNGTVLSDITNEISYGQNGYAYMINGNGTTVAHPDEDKVFEQWNPIETVEDDQSLTSVANLYSGVIAENRGVSQYTYEGNRLYAGYAPVPGTEWILVVTANESEVLSSISELQKRVITILAVILVGSITIIYLLGKSITNPIIKIIEHSNKIAKLDISENVPNSLLNKKDEVGRLSKALQTITINLRETIYEINASSEQVSASSEELTATSQQSAMTTEEVAKTVEEIALGAVNQAQNTQEGSSKAIMLGEIVAKDQDYLKELNEASQKVNYIVDEGLTEIEKLSKIVTESSAATFEVQEGIIKTNESAEKIGEASSLIATIAKQTNLLALNAAIEAARAGDAGKGFSVVADEIRKLAEQSTNSTKTIDTIVKELQANSQSAVEIMERVSRILVEQDKSVKDSKDKYITIDQAMKATEIVVKKLNISSQEVKTIKDTIIDTLQNLSAIAEENSASTEEVSATMEEQSASMDEISRASASLSELAQSLQSIIIKFKV